MKQGAERQDSGFDRLAARELSRRQSRQAIEPCLQAEQIAAWLDRSLPEEEAAAVQKHVAACGRCEAIAAAIVQSEPEVIPARPRAEARSWVWHLRWLAPAATAVVIVAVALTATLERSQKATLDRPLATSTAPAAGPLQTPAVAEVPAAQAPPAAAAAAAPAPTTTARASTPSPSAPPQRGRDTKLSAPSPSYSRAEGTMARQEAPAAARPVTTETGTVAPQERMLTIPIRDKEDAQPGGAGKAEAKQAAVRSEEKIRTTPGGAVGGTVGGVVAGVSAPATAAPPPAEPVAEDAMKAPPKIGVTAVRQMSAAAPAPSPAGVGAMAPGNRVRWLYARPGVILRSENAGSSWSEQALPGDARLSAVSAVSPLVCWGVGRALVVRTVDGRTWQTVPSPAPTDLVAVAARSEAAATVRTADGVTYETSDGGATWLRR